MSLNIGDVVELDRLSGRQFGAGKYVVAAIAGGPSQVGNFVTLIKKRAGGGYVQFVRSDRDLTPIDIEPFSDGEKVRINGVGETGSYLSSENGVARVLMPAWTMPLEGKGGLSIESSITRVSAWSLVLENRT